MNEYVISCRPAGSRIHCDVHRVLKDNAPVEVGDFLPWRRIWTSTGVEFSLRDRPSAGFIHVVPRLSPVRSVRSIVESARDEVARQASAVRVIAARRLVTSEGQDAALVSMFARVGDIDINRDIGVIFADDFQAVIDASYDTAHGGQFSGFVLKLVESFPMYAGGQARRVEFTSPAGWAPRSRGLLTHFYSPSYHSDRALLSVAAAVRLHRTSLVRAAIHEDLLSQFHVSAFEPEQLVESFYGLTGRFIALSGESNGNVLHVQAVLLQDAEYRYVVRLQSATKIDPEAVLLPTARSLRPVPKDESLAAVQLLVRESKHAKRATVVEHHEGI